MGTGVAALCVAARVPAVHVTGIEIASRYALLAEQNARRNGFGENDPGHPWRCEGCAAAATSPTMPAHGSFSHAFANPPYFEEGTTTPRPTVLKATATTVSGRTISICGSRCFMPCWRRAARVTLIHRAESLGRLLTAMESRFGDIRVAPVYGRAKVPAASRIIVQGVKGSQAPLQLLPGLVLHARGGAIHAGSRMHPARRPALAPA